MRSQDETSLAIIKGKETTTLLALLIVEILKKLKGPLDENGKKGSKYALVTPFDPLLNEAIRSRHLKNKGLFKPLNVLFKVEFLAYLTISLFCSLHEESRRQ